VVLKGKEEDGEESEDLDDDAENKGCDVDDVDDRDDEGNMDDRRRCCRGLCGATMVWPGI